MKKCAKCKEIKSPSEYYKNNARKDGLQDECKACRRIIQREGKRKPNSFHRKEAAKQKHLLYVSAYKKRFPEKRRARVTLGRAVKKGIIIRLNVCEHCGKEGKTCGHHDDYNKPLEVVWVCQPCHIRIHYGE